MTKNNEVEIQGYGCKDDCDVYYEKSSSYDGCGWGETCETICIW